MIRERALELFGFCLVVRIPISQQGGDAMYMRPKVDCNFCCLQFTEVRGHGGGFRAPYYMIETSSSSCERPSNSDQQSSESNFEL